MVHLYDAGSRPGGAVRDTVVLYPRVRLFFRLVGMKDNFQEKLDQLKSGAGIRPGTECPSETEWLPLAAGLLPEARSLLVLQSDLTAVVSGQPSAAAARLLAAAAVPEARGVATTWRFSRASVRSALDAGWTAEELTAELAAVTDRALPQPLEYLIADVARRHGAVRVRGARCVVTGSPWIGPIFVRRPSSRSVGPVVLPAASPMRGPQ